MDSRDNETGKVYGCAATRGGVRGATCFHESGERADVAMRSHTLLLMVGLALKLFSC